MTPNAVRAGVSLFGASFFSYRNVEHLLGNVNHRVKGFGAHSFMAKLLLQTGNLRALGSVIFGADIFLLLAHNRGVWKF